MAKAHFGELPPRYTFTLNPYPDYRFSRCPGCDQPTRARKFVLFLHIEPAHFVALGKTCRYCPTCEWIIAHQDELESELAYVFSQRAPKVIGNPYRVIGTLDRTAWRAGLKQTRSIGEQLPHVADFKEVLDIKVRPAGWYPSEEDHA